MLLRKKKIRQNEKDGKSNSYANIKEGKNDKRKSTDLGILKRVSHFSLFTERSCINYLNAGYLLVVGIEWKYLEDMII